MSIEQISHYQWLLDLDNHIENDSIAVRNYFRKRIIVAELFELTGNMHMPNEHSLDEMRRRIQESMVQAKREQLRGEFGMQFDHVDSRLSLEAHNEWLDSILEFERSFENAPRITVRERIGSQPVEPIETIPLFALEEAVDNLAEHGIAIDFIGDWHTLATRQGAEISRTLLPFTTQSLHRLGCHPDVAAG